MSDNYYISASQAAQQLERRAHLRSAVEDYWREHGIEFPAALRTDPFAAMSRHVPTFRFEDGVFTRMAEETGLNLAWLGYTGDMFATQSSGKRSLLKPQLTERVNKHGEPIVRTAKLVDVPDWCHGKPLNSIRTKDGDWLVEWHEQRLRRAVPQATTMDLSEVYQHWGGRSNEYYVAYLSLFLAHGVLFEDYHGGESGESLNGFTAKVFEPSVAELERIFGVGPLVVSLPWWKELAFYPDGAWLDDWRSCEVILRGQCAA